MTRADHLSGTDRLAEAITLLDLDDDEIVVNLQGDEPLMPPTLIRAVADLLAARPARSWPRPVMSLPSARIFSTERGQGCYRSRGPCPVFQPRPYSCRATS